MAAAINNALGQLVQRPVARLAPAQGSGAVVDEENSLVYGIDPGTDDVAACFSVSGGGSLAFAPTANGSGTGSTLTVYDAYGDTVGTFTLVIFGDVDGDSFYDGYDAYLVACLNSGALTEDDFSAASLAAADCDHSGVIDANDADILEQAGVLLRNVNQTKTRAELENDAVFIEYLSLIDQTVPAEEDPTEVVVISTRATFFDKLLSFINTILAFFRNLIMR
jgi:hypothetical protein